MSFVFRGSRGDIETGFPGFIPERRSVVYPIYFLYYVYMAKTINIVLNL